MAVLTTWYSQVVDMGFETFPPKVTTVDPLKIEVWEGFFTNDT